MNQQITPQNKPPGRHYLPEWWQFWETIPLAWGYLMSQHIPKNGKVGYMVASIALLVYVIFPIDIIPELFLPVIGYVDDVGTIPAFFALTSMFIGWCEKNKLS
ncbi:MAG: DUF1232 domain-containing protein [bacterium]|nr:DUF1232 domain-containing protein [bacterium]